MLSHPTAVTLLLLHGQMWDALEIWEERLEVPGQGGAFLVPAATSQLAVPCILIEK